MNQLLKKLRLILQLICVPRHQILLRLSQQRTNMMINRSGLGFGGVVNSSLRSLLLCSMLIAGASQPAYSQQNPDNSEIVVLFHNANLSSFKQEIGLGLREYIDSIQADFPYLNVSYEFLGLDNFPSQTRPSVLIEHLKHNQQVKPAAVIMPVMGPTVEFLTAYGDEIYGELPRVYVLPDPAQAELFASQNLGNVRVIPTTSAISAENTLLLIPRLFPEIEHIYVVSGAGSLDARLAADSQTALDGIEIEPDVTFISGLPLIELNSALENLPENSAIIMLMYSTDTNGSILRENQVLQSIQENINLPIFSPVSSLQLQGVIGGSVANNRLVGNLAGNLAVSLLSDVDSPDPLTSATTNYMFDQSQLRRWRINERLLPSGSIVESAELSFVDLYGQVLLIFLAVVGALLVLVAFLKRQSSALGAQKNLFESVIDSIPDAIFITDAEARIHATNKGAEQLFAVEPGELQGRHVRGLLDFSVVIEDKNRGNVESLQSSVEPQVLKYKKKNGEIFSGETIATQITSSGGEMLGHFALIRDISKRLSLEEEQRQGQKMEALGNLVGGISHDFNNILGVISGYAELSLVSEEPKLIETNQNQILKATDRAKSLIGQITTFSRDSNIGQKPTDLGATLDDTMKLIKVSVPSTIELIVRKGKGVQAVMGSAIQLQQIILNLTTNANHAMKSSGGSITISLERNEVATETNLSHGVLQPGCYSVLTIADNGPGMSQELASRVFDPYFTTKARGEGSGMGMAIVYKLLKAHDAILDMKTAPGEGLSLAMYFREAPELSSVMDADNEDIVVRGNGEHILLVDDEEDLLDATQQLLSRSGYQVSAFTDPDEALKTFSREPDEFDLLVSDQSMPKLTGVQLLRAARELNPNLQAIICTGYSELLNLKDVAHLDLSAILSKPYTLGEILRAIAEALTTETREKH